MTSNVWGGRFSKERDPLIIKFNESLSFDHILYKYDIMGSISHSQMLAKQGLITNEESQILIKTLKEIEQELKDNKIELDINHEDIHMLVESKLIEKIGDIGKKLHTARSRNDQVQLDVRLYIRDMGDNLIELITQLTIVLGELESKYSGAVMPGYTHLQQAQPITLGNYHQAYKHMFQRDIARFEDWKKRMNYSPLGACALSGTNLPIDKWFVANDLKFDGIIENTIDAVSDRDYVIEFLSACSITMVHLSRLSEDIIIWSSTEFNFLILDDAFSTGSSIMPNKKNPDIAELVRGKSGRAFGNLMGMLTAIKGLPLSYNKDLQEDKEFIFDSVKTLKSCLEIMAPFLKSMTYNTDVMKTQAESGYLSATIMMEKLIIKGMPFRTAHLTIGNLVKQSVKTGKTLNEVWNEYNQQ